MYISFKLATVIDNIPLLFAYSLHSIETNQKGCLYNLYTTRFFPLFARSFQHDNLLCPLFAYCTSQEKRHAKYNKKESKKKEKKITERQVLA